MSLSNLLNSILHLVQARVCRRQLRTSPHHTTPHQTAPNKQPKSSSHQHSRPLVHRPTTPLLQLNSPLPKNRSPHPLQLHSSPHPHPSVLLQPEPHHTDPVAHTANTPWPSPAQPPAHRIPSQEQECTIVVAVVVLERRGLSLQLGGRWIGGPGMSCPLGCRWGRFDPVE